MKKNYVIKLWERLSLVPGGRWLLTQILINKAPYFKNIRPRVIEVSPTQTAVTFKKRKAVGNHIGTIHVIATCNAMEMAMGILAEASIPPHLRWIPKGMEVDYLVKGETDLTAYATIRPEDWKVGDVFINIEARDKQDRTVISGRIKLWVTEKKPKAKKLKLDKAA